jgi:hypothetical protein
LGYDFRHRPEADVGFGSVKHIAQGDNMRRSKFIGTSLIALLLILGLAPTTFAEESPDVTNIGFVLYTKSYAPGTLNARWMFTDKYRGPGIATGGPEDGYAGQYHVRYFYDSGEFSDEYDLVIEKTEDTYKVLWLVDGEVLAIGVGMEVENGLAVGWRRVSD